MMKLNPTRAALAVFVLAAASPLPAFAQMGAGDPVPLPGPADGAGLGAADPAAPAAGAPAAPAMPSISLSTAQVTELQTLLAQAGFDPGGIDGIWGPATQSALTAYQQAQSLPVGDPTEELLQSMRTSVVGAAPEAPPPAPPAP
jgi:peptidoglycan hydrolase-like protein with peptidoglycan-binding domain